MSEIRTVRQAIGQRIREIRTAHGRQQWHIADAARTLGLAWDQSRVAGLERGAKALSAEELLRLPLVLQWAGCGSPTLADLLPSDRNERIRLDSSTTASAGLLRDVLAGQADPRGTITPAGATPRGFGLPRFGSPADEPAEHRDAERTAAARLGIPVADVVRLSRTLWEGRSLTDERDRLVAARSSVGDTPDRTAALRGRVTRDLIEQLRTAGPGR